MKIELRSTFILLIRKLKWSPQCSTLTVFNVLLAAAFFIAGIHVTEIACAKDLESLVVLRTDIDERVSTYLDQSFTLANELLAAEMTYSSSRLSEVKSPSGIILQRPSSGDKFGCDWTVETTDSDFVAGDQIRWQGRPATGVCFFLRSSGVVNFARLMTRTHEIGFESLEHPVVRSVKKRISKDNAYVLIACPPLASVFGFGDLQFAFRHGLLNKDLKVVSVHEYHIRTRDKERWVFTVQIPDLYRLSFIKKEGASPVPAHGEVEVDPNANFAITRSWLIPDGSDSGREIRVKYTKVERGLIVPELVQIGACSDHRNTFSRNSEFFNLVLNNEDDSCHELPFSSLRVTLSCRYSLIHCSDWELYSNQKRSARRLCDQLWRF